MGKLKRRLATLIKSGDYDYERPYRREVREAVVLSIGENDMVTDWLVQKSGLPSPGAW